MDDLVKRLLAAIGETEDVAHATGTPAGWEADGIQVFHSPRSGLHEGEVVAEGDCCGGGCYNEQVAAHIARNSPEAVLKRCTSDRLIVENYQQLLAAPAGTYGIEPVRQELRFVLLMLAMSYGVAA